MEKLVMLAFVLLIVQGVLTYFQVKNYRKKVSEFKKFGLVGVGTVKGGIKAGNITILACDKKGNIVKCEKMEGMTVFTRFKAVQTVVGMNIKELKESILSDSKTSKMRKNNAMLQAIGGLESRIEQI